MATLTTGASAIVVFVMDVAVLLLVILLLTWLVTVVVVAATPLLSLWFGVACLATPQTLDSPALVKLLPALLATTATVPLESGRERSAFFERLAHTLSLCSFGCGTSFTSILRTGSP